MRMGRKYIRTASLKNRTEARIRSGEANYPQATIDMSPQSTVISIREAIFSGDNRRLKTQIQTLLTQSVSSFDTAGVKTAYKYGVIFSEKKVEVTVG